MHRRLGTYEEAVPLMIEALAGTEQLMGVDSPESLVCHGLHILTIFLQAFVYGTYTCDKCYLQCRSYQRTSDSCTAAWVNSKRRHRC